MHQCWKIPPYLPQKVLLSTAEQIQALTTYEPISLHGRSEVREEIRKKLRPLADVRTGHWSQFDLLDATCAERTSGTPLRRVDVQEGKRHPRVGGREELPDRQTSLKLL